MYDTQVSAHMETQTHLGRHTESHTEQRDTRHPDMPQPIPETKYTQTHTQIQTHKG